MTWRKKETMWKSVYLIAVYLCGCCVGQQKPSVLPQPPVMTVMPDKVVYYKYSETVMMPCKGHGTAPLVFTWEKDKVPFQPRSHNKRMVQLANEGTIVINFPELKDEGFYQCFAKNSYGIAMSSIVKLQPGRLADFKQLDGKTWTRRLGEKLTLPCTPPTSMPPAKVAWVISLPHRTVTVEYDEHVTIDRDGNLHFLNLRADDSKNGASYRCMVVNEFMRDNRKGGEHKIQLMGQKPVERPISLMFNSQLEMKAILHDDLSMKCVFAGNPTPMIQWVKAVGMIPEERRQIRSFGMELVILNVQWVDQGNYECRASNPVEQISQTRSFIVTVNSRPVWQEKPRDVETTVRRTAKFVCSGRGVPRPQIDVWANAVLLKDYPGKAILNAGSSGNLSFVEVIYNNLEKSDTKVLQCNVTNNYGFVFTNFLLNVLEEPPRFLQAPLKETKVAEKNSIRLFCQTSGKPDPTISWFKGSRPMTGGRYRIQRNGDLLIKRAVLSDAGVYKCVATNKFGSETGSGRLIVRSQTKLVQKPMDLQVDEGKPAKFTCSATTDPLELPDLKIMWFKDSLEVLSNSQRMTANIQDNSLTVTDTIPRDSGMYTCMATAGIDNATASGMLTVKGLPSKPTMMRIKEGECNKRSVQLLWTAGSDNNALISKYYVEYNTSYTPDLWVRAKEVPKTAAMLTISPHATYTFRVRSVNKIGESDPSRPTKECVTAEDAPDMNPENVKTIGDMKQHLIIEWTPMPMIQHNGRNFKYNILYKKKTGSKYILHPETEWQTSRFVIKVDQTEPYQPYDIKVQAENSIGQSVQALKTHIGYSGESEPKIIPQNLELSIDDDITATSVTLIWDPVDLSQPGTMNGEFRGYKIQYWKSNGKRTTFREHKLVKEDFSKKCLSGKMCAVLTQLIPFTYMESQVVVINNFYMGPPSNMLSFTTKEGLPGPVKSLFGLVAGPNHFKLKWEHPDKDDRNGILIAYDIAYQTVDALVLGKLKDRDTPVDPDLDMATLSGLLPSQRYRVHIWAVTKIGRGEDHYIELNTTAAGVSDAPTFEFKFIGAHSINISWHQYVTSGSQRGSIFFVEYRKNGLSEWMKSPDEMVKYWANISSLESGTRYEVRVVTTNGLDYVPSAVQRATTLGVGAVHVPTAGWFIGMLVIIFILLILIVIIIILVKYFNFTFDCCPQNQEPRVVAPVATTHRGYPAHRGYQPGYAQRQESYDDQYGRYDSRERQDSTEKRPPSYSDIDNYHENRGEPNKFDNGGTPRVEVRDPANKDFPANKGDNYDDRYRDDDRYDDRYRDDRDDDRYRDDGRDDDRYRDDDHYDDRDRDDDRYRDDDKGYDNRHYDDRDHDDSYDREPRGGAYTPTKSCVPPSDSFV